MDLDGIIGSNLMRLCVWRVDYSKNTLLLTNQPEKLSNSLSYLETQFKTDRQHNIKIDFKTQHATIKNLKIDYGSTGYINVPNKVYNVLMERGDLGDPLTEVGYRQGGIFGEIESDTIEIGVVESGKIDSFDFGKVEILSSGKGLLGTKILKNYIVTMDWSNRTIGFDFFSL